MGLLDFLNTGDPQKDAAISRGLLQAGLQLMQTKGRFLPGLSQGGLAGLQGFDQAQQAQYQQKLQKAQLDAIERKKVLDAREDTLANLPSEFIKPPSQGNNPSAYTPGSQDLEGLIQKYMATPGGLQTGLNLQQMLRKQGPTPHTVGAGGKLVFTDQYGKVVSTIDNQATDKDKESPLARLLQEQAQFPPNSPQWKVYEEAIKKQSTHQPPVSLNNYGSPLPIDIGGGQTGYIQPPQRPGGPSQVLTVPGTGKPAIKPIEGQGKLGEAQKKQVAGIDALGSAVDEYVKELSTFPISGVINPSDRARIGTKYNNMMLQAKEAYNLGVLNGPDYQILQSVVADPVSLRGMTTSNRSLALQATELKRMMEQVKKGITKTDADNDPLGIRK